MTELFAVLGLVVVAGGLAVRWRLRRMRRGPSVGEAEIRRIEEDGTIRTSEPEPLDLEDVRASEEDFWAERWDEPEPW